MVDSRTHGRLATIVVAMTVSLCLAGETPWRDIPPAQWKGTLAAEVPALSRKAAAAVALPASDAGPLTATSAEGQPPGLYEIRLTLRPSHTADAIAFNAGLRVRLNDQPAGEFPGCFFARPHEPETRVAAAVHAGTGPLAVVLEAFADPAITEAAWVASDLKKGGPKPRNFTDLREEGDDEMDIALETVLAPAKAVYYVVDKIEYRPLSRSGRVTGVETDRIRYVPGATLKGRAFVADVGGRGGNGTLNVHLEHGVGERTKAKSLPVILGAKPAAVDFELPLPKTELGYALVAEYVSSDGGDRSEAAEYFTMASNFQRVAIFGGGLATRDAVLDDETIRQDLDKARSDYGNAVEYFAWAEDDLLGMSPPADFWTAGQANYRMHKQTIQRQIQMAHERGIAVSTYGKYLMSGFPGWDNVYRNPDINRGPYQYHPVGMWAGVNVPLLDRRRDRDYISYIRKPSVPGHAFVTWWAEPLWINATLDPPMVRMAAEACIRSIEMFGWDAIRWDDHPRGGGQCGRAGGYDQAGARRTQSLVRYFKDVVARRYPDFRHGYNYIGVQREKNHDWAKEDFELDELCRGGGLLMNESIGNASGGYTFAQIARNLQVDGDLCRERGGYYLGISYAKSPRDVLIESALWGAAGCRPYGTMDTRVRRYCTRFAQYTFDENLRRLAQPEKVIMPQAETRLWWQPFVYETPTDGGRRQLVVNLLNLPLEDKRPGRDSSDPPVWNMPAGTDPVEFALTLPAGLKAIGARRIDPWTLAVEPVALVGNRCTVAPVAIWSVLVVDLEVAAGAPALAALYGVPVTCGVKRPDLEEARRRPEVALDPGADAAATRRAFAVLQPSWEGWREKQQAELEALSPDQRERKLEELRPTPESLIGDWWKGYSLPADLSLKDKTFAFGDLAPRRNGRVDIFHARGAMDYPLRMPWAFGRLDRVRVQDAPLWGSAPNMGLANGFGWRRYSEFDLLLFTAIPHCAIGAENAYALVDYVQAGGAAFFTGGEYAFGKGGYMHTVLERELLPVRCFSMYDTMVATPPRPIEPGPDFAELRVNADFAARPVFWVRNQVSLKPGAKVFLKSGDHPLLVGWQLGKGRVACLLLDHRGQSGDGVTAFFDWADWPKLAAAVMAWLTPDAARTDPPRVAAGTREALRKFEAADTDDLLNGLEDGDAGTGLGLSAHIAPVPQTGLEGAALKSRAALIESALEAEGDNEVATALARQLAVVGTLPLETRLRLIAFLGRNRPAAAAELGQAALRTGDSVLHGSGYVLLALAGDPAFVKVLAEPSKPTIDTEAAARERGRELALAVALYPKPDLISEGRRRIEAWNRQEESTRTLFVKQVEPDRELIATSGPYLDAEAVFQRIAWLAYLSRYDPKNFAAPFVREWLMSGQYQDYCWRSIQNYLHVNKGVSDTVTRVGVQDWSNLSARLGQLRDITQPDVESLFVRAPGAAAAALSGTRFMSEARLGVNLLGDRPGNQTAEILSVLEKTAHPDLAGFAAERKAAP